MSAYNASSVDLGLIYPQKDRPPQRLASASVREEDDEPVNTFSSAVDRANLALKGNILENEQLLEITYDLGIESARSSQDLLMSRLGLGRDSLTAMCEEYRWAIPSGYTKDSIIDDNDLKVSRGTLRKLLRQTKRFTPVEVISSETTIEAGRESPRNRPDIVAAVDKLDQRRKSMYESHTPSEKSQASTNALTSINVPIGLTRSPEVAADHFAEMLRQRIGSARAEVIGSSLRSTCCALLGSDADYGSMLMQLSNFVHTDVLQYIRDRLTQDEPAYLGLLGKYESVRKERDEAMQKEDFVTADKKCRELLDSAEKCVTATWNRVNTCMMSSANEGNFRSAYEKLRHSLDDKLAARREAALQNSTEAKSDIIVCKDKSTEIDQENTRALAQYGAQRTAREEKISQNVTQQKEIWDKMVVLLGELQVLGKERSELAKAHMDAIEEEYKRRRHYQEHSDVLSRHMDHLSSVAIISDAALQLLNSIDDFTESAYIAIETRNLDEGLSDIRVKELLRFQDAYKLFVVNATERTACYSNRQTLLQQRLNTLELHSVSALSTLDPYNKSYKETRLQIEAGLKEAMESLESVAARERKLGEHWQEVSQSLEERRTQPRSPRSWQPSADVEGLKILDMDELRATLFHQNTAAVIEDVQAAVTTECDDCSTAEMLQSTLRQIVEESTVQLEQRRKGKLLKVVDPNHSQFSPTKMAATIDHRAARRQMGNT